MRRGSPYGRAEDGGVKVRRSRRRRRLFPPPSGEQGLGGGQDESLRISGSCGPDQARQRGLRSLAQYKRRACFRRASNRSLSNRLRPILGPHARTDAGQRRKQGGKEEQEIHYGPDIGRHAGAANPKASPGGIDTVTSATAKRSAAYSPASREARRNPSNRAPSTHDSQPGPANHVRSIALRGTIQRARYRPRSS